METKIYNQKPRSPKNQDFIMKQYIYTYMYMVTFLHSDKNILKLKLEKIEVEVKNIEAQPI